MANDMGAEKTAAWSNEWSVAAIFFDFDQDGRMEALVAPPDQRASKRFDWTPMRMDKEGRVSMERGLANTIIASCYPFAIYEASLSGGLKALLARDGYVEKYVSGNRVWNKEGDYIFRLTPDGCMAPELSSDLFDKVVRNPGFISIQRAQPEWYLAKDLGSPLEMWKEGPSCDSGKPPSGGIVLSEYVKTFVKHHRFAVKSRLGISSPLTMLVVCLDADNDGDEDCYVSSDAEQAGDGRYRWSLFLNTGGSFRKATERVWFNRGTCRDVGMLEPEEVATREAFYRVVRSDCGPMPLVMETEDGRLHTHAYLHLVSKEDRARRPPQDPEIRRRGGFHFEEWEGEVMDKLGFRPPKDFRDQISWLSFVRLERLPCASFPEDPR